MGLIESQRTFQPNAADYTFFSSAYGKFSMIDHNLENKTSLNTFKKIKTISGFFFFFCHNDYNLEESWKNHKYVETKQHVI